MSVSTEHDKNGMPFKDSFAFGYGKCALCDGIVRGTYKTFNLDEPVWADYAKTEVLIPAGRQSFHTWCWLKLETDNKR